MKKGDVLFGKRRAYQKKVAISPIDGVFSAHGMVLRPKEDVICKEFLPFFISSDYFLNEAIRISVGGLSPTINWKDIKELVPPAQSGNIIKLHIASQSILMRLAWIMDGKMRHEHDGQSLGVFLLCSLHDTLEESRLSVLIR